MFICNMLSEQIVYILYGETRKNIEKKKRRKERAKNTKLIMMMIIKA